MFVVFNKEMDLIGHSKPFKFRNCIVEYCMGMILNKKNLSFKIFLAHRKSFSLNSLHV